MDGKHASYVIHKFAETPIFPLRKVSQIYQNYGLCQQFEDNTLDQVWTFSDGIAVPGAEFTVNGRLVSFSNGFGGNQPACGEAGAAFGFIYSNLNGGNYYPALRYQALHSYAHYLEWLMQFRWQYDKAKCDYVDGNGRLMSYHNVSDTTHLGFCNGSTVNLPPSWSYGFTNHPHANNNYVGVCGDVHFPPNTMPSLAEQYIYTKTVTASSICNDWDWGQTNTIEQIGCSTWSSNCSNFDLTQSGFMVWWMQRLPGYDGITSFVGRNNQWREYYWNVVPWLRARTELVTRQDFDNDRKTDFAVFLPSAGVYWIKPFASGNGYVVNNNCIRPNPQPRTRREINAGLGYFIYETGTGIYYNAIYCNQVNSVPANLIVGSGKFGTGSATFASDGWRYDPATGNWTISYWSGNYGPFPSNFQLGGAGYVPAIADYDGDLLLDPAVYNKTTGDWKIYLSSTSTISTSTWGASSNYEPVPADYDGDSKAEKAVFDKSSATWYISPQTWLGTQRTKQWGNPNDTPVPADYDGDGFDDIAIWRPGPGWQIGTWWILRRNETTIYYSQLGAGSDVPMSYKPW